MPTPELVAPWLPWVALLVSAVLGSGGIAAWVKLNKDSKQGIANHELDEENSEADRWRLIIETQTKNLLEPMKAQLQELQLKVERLEAELETSKRKYWLAINYVRILIAWIHRTTDVADLAPPAPAEIAPDI
jgi:hypothetical protein